MDNNHKDLNVIDLSVPRRAQGLHKAWKKNQNTVYWNDTIFALKKGLKFYQTRSNAIILQKKLLAYCFPKIVRMKNGEVINEKISMPPPPPSKICLKHKWKRKLGPELGQRPKVRQLFQSFQSIQPIPERGNPMLKMTRESCKIKEKRPVLKKSIIILFTKKLFIRKERRDPLLKRR